MRNKDCSTFDIGKGLNEEWFIKFLNVPVNSTKINIMTSVKCVAQMITLRNNDQANPSSNPSGRTFFYEIKALKYTNRCMINEILIYIHPRFS